jgi:hypothetical protein
MMRSPNASAKVVSMISLACDDCGLLESPGSG